VSWALTEDMDRRELMGREVDPLLLAAPAMRRAGVSVPWSAAGVRKRDPHSYARRSYSRYILLSPRGAAARLRSHSRIPRADCRGQMEGPRVCAAVSRRRWSLPDRGSSKSRCTPALSGTRRRRADESWPLATRHCLYAVTPAECGRAGKGRPRGAPVLSRAGSAARALAT